MRASPWACALLLALRAAPCGADAAPSPELVTVVAQSAPALQSPAVGGDDVPLRLCDCYASATAQQREGELPNNLSCDKEGFFVAGFQRAGVFNGAGSSAFALSAAICCRPCFGDDAASAAVAADVAAVVSTGCVQSRWEGAGQACPDTHFITGYASARLGSPINRYYPVGQALCCRPALLLRNGSTRLLRRCAGSCGAPAGGSEVSCGGGDDEDAALAGGRLLAGWGGVLRQPGSALGLTDAIPTAPAHCCAACVDTTAPARGLPCETSNFCSGHGACGLGGRCVCDRGWGGPACSDGAAPAADALLASAPAIVVAVLVASICMAGLAARANALSRALAATRRAAALAAAARRAELEQPLLPVSSSDDDAEWGAGSSSSDDDDDDDNADDDGSGSDGDGEADATQAPPHQALPPAEGQSDTAAQDAPPGYAPPSEVGADDKPATAAAEEPAAQAAAAAAVPRRNWLRNAPECNVCMDARVQIVFLPCGHACACRPCARRLRRCPICRVVVTRRQKLFLSSGLD